MEYERKTIIVLTGAGISAASGLPTYRGGSWQSLELEDLKAAAKEAKPNLAHLALAELGKIHDVYIITQNIDDLHEQAGSQNVIHMHGSLKNGDLVNFVEEVKQLGLVSGLIYQGCDYFLQIGTSAVVRPANQLIDMVYHDHPGAETVEFNLERTKATRKFDRLMPGDAQESVIEWVHEMFLEREQCLYVQLPIFIREAIPRFREAYTTLFDWVGDEKLMPFAEHVFGPRDRLKQLWYNL